MYRINTCSQQHIQIEYLQIKKLNIWLRPRYLTRYIFDIHEVYVKIIEVQVTNIMHVIYL